MKMNPKWTRFWNIQKHNAGGFTLVELVVVIAILAILAGAAVPAYSGYINKANEAADQQLLAALNTAYASACMENGKFDMTQLGFTPVATISETGVTMSQFDDSFQNYFGNGAFKYYDKLGFVASEGVFKGNTVAQLIQIMKEAWHGSSFANADDGGEAILGTLLGTFDTIGGYFAEGFSMENLLSGSPEAVRAALGLGTFNLTDAEILEKYCPEYAALSDPEKAAWLEDENNKDKINTIKGNAYVLHMANDAAGKDGATVLADVKQFVSAIQEPADNDAILAYYKTLPGVDLNTTDEKLLEEAKQKLAIAGAGIDAGTVVAMVNNNMTNESGISTLGSMYALAAGYMNSGYYEKSELYGVLGDVEPDYSDFSTFMKIVQYSGNFQEYCDNLGATDLDAYLGFMDSLSAGDVNMEDSEAFVGQFGNIWGNIDTNK